MYTVEEALQKILSAVFVGGSERVALADSLGRVLASDVTLDIPLPPFTNSAVDGYAVRTDDTLGAGASRPRTLTCIEDIPAGAWPTRTLGRGECARIMTGAPVPAGADAVVMVEDTREQSKEQTREQEIILILEAARRGQHVRAVGQDAQIGERLLRAGDAIQAAQVGLLAQRGCDMVDVTCAPRVAVISTGDEVIEIASGAIPPPGKIRNSNSYALEALAREAGAIIHSRRHIPDDLAATQAALRECSGAAGADVIITAGGVSVGDRDFVRAALESLGTLELWRVAMKPGKPVAFGRIGRTLFFGLPGNPVSAQITFELFARPALLKMAGRRDAELSRPQVTATLLAPVAHVPPRREYVRALTEWRDGKYVALPLGGQGSADLATLCRANSLLIVPETSEGAQTGDVLPVLLLNIQDSTAQTRR